LDPINPSTEINKKKILSKRNRFPLHKFFLPFASNNPSSVDSLSLSQPFLLPFVYGAISEIDWVGESEFFLNFGEI
jgi:hypothetical protein